MKSLLAIIIFTGKILCPLAQAQQAPPPAAPAAAKLELDASKTKLPLSASDIRAFGQIADVMQFHIQIGQDGFWKKDAAPIIKEYGQSIRGEMVKLWSPIVGYMGACKVDNKFIPFTPRKKDTENLKKIRGIKDPNEWGLEYFKLMVKEGKKNIREVEAATKNINDSQLKTAAGVISEAVTRHVKLAEENLLQLNPKK